MNVKDLKNCLRNGPYAWPGGYPVYFVTVEGETLSHKAVKAHVCDVLRSTLGYRGGSSEWNLIGMEINWEDAALYCADNGERIESAYAEDEA